MKHKQAELFDPMQLPLQGYQLIEASAGTGKTFNITRLYLRAILQSELGVEHILVMTFSKAATEEIRGRVAQTLREAVGYWQQRLSGTKASEGDDPVFAALYEKFSTDQALKHLQSNLLLVDDAAIFTIHSFCQQMLSEYAYDAGNALDATLHTDTQDALLQCTADWLRSLQQSPQKLLALAEFGWHQPSAFWRAFGGLVRSPLPLEQLSESALAHDHEQAIQALEKQFSAQFTQVRNHLNSHHALLFEGLTQHKDASVQLSREAEWGCLQVWLEDALPKPADSSIKALLNGNRYRGNAQVKQAVEPIKALIAALSKALSDVDKKHHRRVDQHVALKCVFEGIKHIAKQFSALKNEHSWLEFDDLVIKLADKVSQSPQLAMAIQQRYPLALVDEFQDTDTAQYRLLKAIYTASSKSEKSALLMIGDPKQAIYGFRGGDIFTYLAAAEQADGVWAMDTNWRSTPQMVAAYNALFAAMQFDFAIQYLAVNFAQSAKANNAPLSDPLTASGDRQALQMVWCEHQDPANGGKNKADIRAIQTQWLSAEINRLLSQCKFGAEPVRTQDIAVLVRSATEAEVVKVALDNAGLASVYMSNQQSVFSTVQAMDCLRVLQGIANKTNDKLISTALLSPLFGLNSAQYNALFIDNNEQHWEQVLSLFDTLALRWQREGVLAMFQQLIHRHYRVQHSAAGYSAERVLSNYLQLAELLQRHSVNALAGDAKALINWLSAQIAAPPLNDESAIVRLETDLTAIQIITQHKSKGLEYPIVFIPFANDYRDATKAGSSNALVYQFYDESKRQLVQQLGDSFIAQTRVKRESQAESARLLYVAITRAVHRCYILMSPFDQSEQSVLGQTFGIKDNDWLPKLDAFCTAHAHVGVLSSSEQKGDAQSQADRQTSSDEETLHAPHNVAVARNQWRLYSYSSLTQMDAYWRRQRADESGVLDVSQNLTASAKVPNDARFSYPKGALPGNVLHDILEQQDFTDRQWHADTDDQLANIISAENAPSAQSVKHWLNEVLDTRFTLRGKHLRLRELSYNKTLREAEFYFPIVNAPTEQLQHWLAELRDNTIKQFKGLQRDEAPAVPAIAIDSAKLQGMMHGFIDLIFEANGKYYVADYKSSFLGDNVNDYHPEHLLLHMHHHDYDLQASLYSVALHRYLQQRVQDYNIHQHFGGAIYFSLRGMHTDNDTNCGVASLTIEPTMLLKLNELFAVDASS